MKLDYSIQKKEVADTINKMEEQKEKGKIAKNALSKQSVATSAMGLPQQPSGNVMLAQTNNGFGRTS